jgi:hypothetical protein
MLVDAITVSSYHYDGYFRPARVSKVLVRPLLKRARDTALATD